MALRDQPYLPLYVQDYLTDEKLNMCSLPTQGIYIKILCVLHKSDPYGTILLKQKDKQNGSSSLNFASKFAKILPVNKDEINKAIIELIDEGCLTMEGDKLFQKRMIRDNEISIIRAKAGKKGGEKTQLFAKAKSEANTEDENENENENIVKSKKGNYKGEKEMFDIFRKNYPGTKRGNETEFDNFIKKHKDWKQILPLLINRLNYQIEAKELQLQNTKWTARWKHLSTWINQRGWEIHINTEE